MLALIVRIAVKPEHLSEFLAATLENARGAHTEPGNLRFDVLQQEDDPNIIHLYEIYKDAAAIEAHRQTPHFKKWQAAVEPWQAQPRTRARVIPVFPASESDY